MVDQMVMHCHYPQRPMENRWKPRAEMAPNCPRCASPNTKFCYYNNYSLSQPRYFCKGCRRYWTKGGSLRNVPVGGGCRKNRRSRPARSASQTGTGSLGYAKNPSFSGDESPERANIDLADVFAKFLNQSSDQCNDHEIGGDELQNMTSPPFTSEEDDMEEFMAQNTNLLELQDILNEELPQDFEPSWSDGDGAATVWGQDFEQFLCNNGDLSIYSNVVSGDWSSTSMDLPSVGKLFQSF